MTTKGKLDTNVGIVAERMVQVYRDGGYFLERKLMEHEPKVFSGQMVQRCFSVCILWILDVI